MSSEDEPIRTSNLPGSASHECVWGLKNDMALLSSVKVRVFFSPGFK